MLTVLVGFLSLRVFSRYNMKPVSADMQAETSAVTKLNAFANTTTIKMSSWFSNKDKSYFLTVTWCIGGLEKIRRNNTAHIAYHQDNSNGNSSYSKIRIIDSGPSDSSSSYEYTSIQLNARHGRIKMAYLAYPYQME